MWEPKAVGHIALELARDCRIVAAVGGERHDLACMTAGIPFMQAGHPVVIQRHRRPPAGDIGETGALELDDLVPVREARRRILGVAIPVVGEYRGLFQRGREERTGGMREMMIDRECVEPVPQKLQGERHDRALGGWRNICRSQDCSAPDDAVVGKAAIDTHEVDVADVQRGHIERSTQKGFREAVVVLDPSKSLKFPVDAHPTVFHDADRGVMAGVN
jgi:hypothetical protein